MPTEPLDEATLDALFMVAPVGLALVDANKRYVRINDIFAAMNGVSAEDHIGRTPSEVLPAVGAGVQSVVEHVLESRLPMVGIELEPPSSAGLEEGTSVRVSLYPLVSNGTSVGVLGIAEPVSG